MISLFDMSDEAFAALTRAEQMQLADDEAREFIRVESMVEAGLAVRAHGLIYSLPLCHDAYGEGNG